MVGGAVSSNSYYYGCYSDVSVEVAVELHIFNDAVYVHSDMTVAKCMDLCATKKYYLFGLLESSHCYCSGSFPTLSKTLFALPSSFCGLPCGGDESQRCGGFTYTDLYLNLPLALNLSLSLPSLDVHLSPEGLGNGLDGSAGLNGGAGVGLTQSETNAAGKGGGVLISVGGLVVVCILLVSCFGGSMGAVYYYRKRALLMYPIQ
eukprot:TRINITY_DN8401_c0_g1_i1.p1 TRINITY_DN8401_c0_g1~~TRINITY_DN8401_c0_g1_i1.p1  ORF type:complete len:225 (+),score=45.42 TRINITY_DN8401_c0_g1_i1:65-676(+)